MKRTIAFAHKREEVCRLPQRLAGRLIPTGCGLLFLLLLFTLCNAGLAVAHDARPPALRDVDLQQRLGEPIPKDLLFRNSSGDTVRLGDYLQNRPVILTLVYYHCQNLCPLVLDGLVRTLRAVAFNIGDQFDVVTVSFDPHDRPAIAAATKAKYIQQYGRPGASDGWHFLTGGANSIDRLTRAAGFRYSYDASTDQFAHATGIMLLTPEGNLSRYFYGIEFSPRDLRLGLVEASARKIGSPIDQLLLFCYHYDPTTGKYGLIITNAIRIAGAATVLALGGFIFLMLRRERGGASQKERTA